MTTADRTPTEMLQELAAAMRAEGIELDALIAADAALASGEGVEQALTALYDAGPDWTGGRLGYAYRDARQVMRTYGAWK